MIRVWCLYWKDAAALSVTLSRRPETAGIMTHVEVYLPIRP